MDFLESLHSTQDLVSLPVVASKVVTMLENDNVHINELAKTIEFDPSIALKILRLANSPIYALRSQVTSVNQAVSTIGLTRVMNIVLGVSIFSKFVYLSNSSIAPFVEKFWRHSATTACVAKSLAQKLKISVHDNEFIGGLIHDIGKLSMIQFDTTQYMKVIDLIENSNMNDAEAEFKVYGITHTQVGEILSQQWKLPQTLCNIIALHDSPDHDSADDAATSLVRLADIICEKSNVGIGERIPDDVVSETSSWKNLCRLYPELSSVNINLMCNELEDDFAKAASLLSTMLSD